MFTFPTSIEVHLRESGFSGTEILLLKQLCLGDPMTLREVAGKTGKSTGVLDQAARKLIEKKIVKREQINGSPRYTVQSLETITSWMKHEMSGQLETFKRRQRDVDLFVSSLQLDINRPAMEYFEGKEGMQHAFDILLDTAKDELLRCFPIHTREEDDPHAELRRSFREKRRSRSIFGRVLAHDTPLGRRFQSRDDFSYRKTLLLPNGTHPFSFEKVILPEMVACLNYEEERICLIKFPHFAESERQTFESLWNLYGTNKPSADDITEATASVSLEELPLSIFERMQ